MELKYAVTALVVVFIAALLFIGRSGGRRVGFGGKAVSRKPRQKHVHPAPAQAPANPAKTVFGVKVAPASGGGWRAKPGTGATRVPAVGTPPAMFGSEVWAEIDGLLDQRRKIDAIKVVREHTGLGLKEAKEAVEEYARNRLKRGRG